MKRSSKSGDGEENQIERRKQDQLSSDYGEISSEKKESQHETGWRGKKLWDSVSQEKKFIHVLNWFNSFLSIQFGLKKHELHVLVTQLGKMSRRARWICILPLRGRSKVSIIGATFGTSCCLSSLSTRSAAFIPTTFGFHKKHDSQS